MDDDAHYAWMFAAWEELRVCGQDQDWDAIRIAKAFSIAVIFLDKDGVLAFDYNGEQDSISDFLNAYDAADKTSKRAVSKLIKNALEESDCFSLASAIADATISKKNWSRKVDKEFINALVVEAGPQESDKNNGKPKKVKKTDPDIVDESKSSADSALALAIGCAAAYLATPCWTIDRDMPAAEIVRDFTIGLATLRETDKASICRSMIENQTNENRKRAIVGAMREAANKGTTKEKRFYKTLATSLKGTRPGEDRENERMGSIAPSAGKKTDVVADDARQIAVVATVDTGAGSDDDDTDAQVTEVAADDARQIAKAVASIDAKTDMVKAVNKKAEKVGTKKKMANVDGAMASVPTLQLLNGANMAAIRADNGVWEIVQFGDAEEIAPSVWRLTRLLRGQQGTGDALAAGVSAGAAR